MHPVRHVTANRVVGSNGNSWLGHAKHLYGSPGRIQSSGKQHTRQQPLLVTPWHAPQTCLAPALITEHAIDHSRPQLVTV